MKRTLWADIPGIGKLFIKTIYLFYDEPQVFLSENAVGKYFSILIDENTWLLSQISSARVKQLEKNIITPRSVFIDPETKAVWKITFDNNQYYADLVLPEQLTEEMLPCEDAFLDLDVEEATLALSRADSIEMLRFEKEQDDLLPQRKISTGDSAVMERRDIVDFSLVYNDMHVKEISCETLATSLDVLQQLLYALSDKNAKIKGPISKGIKEKCELQCAGTFAASFGVRLKSNECSDLDGETDLTPVLIQLSNLLSCSGEPDLLRGFLEEMSPKVIMKYRQLLKTLISHKTGICIDLASPNDKSYKGTFSIEDLSMRLKLIDSEADKIEIEEEYDGELVGIDVKSYKFVFIASNDEVIKGKISSDLFDREYKVPMYATIRVIQRVANNAYSGPGTIKYELISCEPLIKTNE